MKEVQEIRARLRDINLVSLSFGKDSTSVLQLVLEALRGTHKQLYIVTADTMMEIPFYQDYMDRQREKLQAYIKRSGINAEIVTVRPSTLKTYWVRSLGFGYPAPHMGFRWCTGAIKTKPIEEATGRMTAGQEFMTFIGVRRAESELRERIYPDADVSPTKYAPIVHWSTEEVWSYLLTEPCPWGDDHRELVQVYRYASDECVYGEKQGVCIGNARYGCWICPLQKDAQLRMISYFTGDARYLELKRYKEVYCAMSAPAYRSRIRRNGEIAPGPFLVSVREDLYRALKRLEAETGWRLISQAEEVEIFRLWDLDSDIHNVADDSSPLLWTVEEELEECGA